jgi:CRP/FNR family cyclic AMP-dependent transcriptional regulator
MQQEIFSALKKIDFLAGLADETLISLAAKAKTIKFPKQAIVITESDETGSLYIILSGKVRVFCSDEKGKEVTLLYQEAGTHFGELALLSDRARSASVKTLEQTVCGVISKEDFVNWLTLHPEAAINMLGSLSEKIISLTEKVKQLALSNVYERIIKLLYSMAHKEGDISMIHSMPSQQELANMVGSSREMVNIVIRELTKGGYISIQGKTLRIERTLPASW